jgi:hypothetical protein
MIKMLSSDQIISNCYLYGGKWTDMQNLHIGSGLNDSVPLFADKTFTQCLIENNVLYMNQTILKGLLVLCLLLLLKLIFDKWLIARLSKWVDDPTKNREHEWLYNIIMTMLTEFYMVILIYGWSMTAWYVMLFWV